MVEKEPISSSRCSEYTNVEAVHTIRKHLRGIAEIITLVPELIPEVSQFFAVDQSAVNGSSTNIVESENLPNSTDASYLYDAMSLVGILKSEEVSVI